MAEAAVTCLLENLTELLKHQNKLISGGEKELQQLKDDIEILKAFLQQVGKNPNPNEEGELKHLNRQIRDVVYEVEDTVDAYLIQMAAANHKSFFHQIRKKQVELQLPRVVKSLREKVVYPILNRVKAYTSTITPDATTSTVEEQPWTIRKKVHTIRMDNVVGMEDEEETITRDLLKENEGPGIISIIGMSGLGKTTLAWKIYHNDTIALSFPVRVWINVSQNFNKREVMLTILKSFTSQDMSSQSNQELSQTVLACLDKERFFLVLDDVCSVEDWQAIREFLPKSNRKGKVLITTTNKNVGAYDNTCMKPHQMRFLTLDESWMLLQLKVFGNAEDCPPELNVIGKVIASRCEGLPLQIVTVGGILVDQLMKSRDPRAVRYGWEKLSENINLFLHNNTSMSIVLELTYSGLPEELRVCLLYMGVFPEDYEISSWTLTRLWIAEGFVQPKGGNSLEETAYLNLDDLINRNLVMVSRINHGGKVKTCRLHDMIHAFCINKAQEQNLFRAVKISQEGVVEPPVSELRESRRLCVDSKAYTLLSQLPKSPRVRSFLCFNRLPINIEPRHVSAIPDAFSLLKVLESEYIKFDKIPRGITRLFHLRYITLSVDDLRILPESFSELWNLQTFVVQTKSRLITMKASIWRLIRLRHLKTNAAIVLSGDMKGEAGENLQTLNRLSPDSCTEEVCTRAHDLKTLGIRGKLDTIYQTVCLGKLARLEKLKLMNDLLFEESVHVDFLHHSFFPPNLKRLTLSNTHFQWKHMPTLAKINSLEVLKLKDNAFVGIYWSAAKDCFPNLQLLIISDTDLIQWEASTSSFPRLRCLQLKRCANLNEIPQALAKTLEELHVDRLKKSAVESARRIGDEKRKAQELEEAKWDVPKFKLHIGHEYC